MRFERTALSAVENSFRIFSSSLEISRWKNMQQINEYGHRVHKNIQHELQRL
ncbi:epoxyqueuosine reductase QueH [Escherichia coli]|uniref:epoxyqueuosine reductase QueH n=1 Tax=Escherichia coli TaxID=562 RepID=UPI0008FEE9FE|nr:epoxyqueuosine reductase QueH [Escherichia coli]EGK3839086.1 hypothetical protein [Escherichia coli]QKB35767.1 hypothetical protein E3156_26445 [Escherichia coli O55:H7]HDH7710831.1 epoxyqueuosine reductase QueH [Escherichia coli]